MKINKAIFLDRDGILIEDVGYAYRLDDMKIREEIIPLLREAQTDGYLLIIVTNQSGIAKNKFTLEEFYLFHNTLLEKLRCRGVAIARTYFCPYHKDGVVEPYNIDSKDRKPGSGMILKAQEEFNLDLKKSCMIGDKFSDRIPILKSFILESPYTKGQGGTYNSFEAIFEVITHGF